MKIALEKLKEHPNNRKLSKDKIQELVESIRLNGLLQNILVEANKDGSYTILAGHHRVAAYKKLTIESTEYLYIEATILDQRNNLLNRNEQTELALIDSNLTSPLTAYETMMAIGRKEEIYKSCFERAKANGQLGKGGVLRDIIAANTPKLKSTQVGKYLRIYKKAILEVKLAFKENQITMEHAAELALLDPASQMQALCSPRKDTSDIYLKQVEERIMHRLGTKCKLKKHKIEINYTSNYDLNRILETLDLLEEI